MKPTRPVLLTAGIILIAINLRPALAAVGPLVDDIRADTGLPNAMIGLLTALPLLAFGAVSVLTPIVTRRIGVEGALAAGLALLTVGALARAAESVVLLFAGTLLLGIGIAAGNVLLPTLVKRDFPLRSGGMTSLYSSVMGVGATLAAGISVPLSQLVGWRLALGLWAVPAIAALLVWLPQLARSRNAAANAVAVPRLPAPSLWRSGLAWSVALFMGFQSLTFYVVLAWLPDLLQSRGFSPADAGWMLALTQLTGIAGTAAVPVWAGRRPEQHSVIWLLGAFEALALAGIILPAPQLVATVSLALLGFILGGTFGLALLLIVLRTADAESATELSGMAQSVGYIIAAAGPVIFGILYDVSGRWTVPLLFLALVLCAKVFAGLGAARARIR